MQNKISRILGDLIDSVYDASPTKDESYAKKLMTVHYEFVNRNVELTKLLKDYISNKTKRSAENKIYKGIIFSLFTSILIALTIVICIVFCKANVKNAKIETVVSLATVAGTYLASILSIVRIISTYLFPIDEEKNTIEMIKMVVHNDVEVETMMSKEMVKTASLNTNKLKQYHQLKEDSLISEEEYNILKKKMFEIL